MLKSIDHSDNLTKIFGFNFHASSVPASYVACRGTFPLILVIDQIYHIFNILFSIQ
jgi:hypothetical protein